MGFWDVFIKTWQVRISIYIQKSIERSLFSREHKRTSSNLHKIKDEVIRKNHSWDELMREERDKTSGGNNRY
jgi:hypothetical protein